MDGVNGESSPPNSGDNRRLRLRWEPGQHCPIRSAPGASITFTGSGFGSSQGSGIVWLGSTAAGQIVSWSDTQIVATVASTALTGIAKIQQNGVWSNALGFTVPSPGGNTIMPSLLNMAVGDIHTIQALSATGQPVTGLTWTSSDPTIVSLSTSDPPILTAVAAGHVTITAGTASADVTVWAGALPLGTVIWSNPGDGSGVQSIVPAVPSTSGVADVFAFQADGTVAAITSDGTTAWTADVSQATGGQPQGSWPGYVLPDFQGGLVVLNYDFNVNSISSIVKLDGSTGEPYPAYTPGPSASIQNAVVHADGTIFALQENWTDPNHDAPLPTTIVGIDPTTGAQKFSVQVNVPQDETSWLGGSMIIAGDGYAYLPYKYLNVYMDGAGESHYIGHIRLLRVSSSGASDAIAIEDGFESCVECSWGSYIITNADQGLLLTWDGGGTGMATTVGTSASLVAPPSPANLQGIVDPVLQAQDGSFVGWYYAGDQYQCCETNMVAFDASGNVRWIVPNDTPQIATADGGVIGQSGITYDQNGNATGMIGSLPTYSWKGAYQLGSVESLLPFFDLAFISQSYAAVPGGNLTGNGFSMVHRTFGLVFCGPAPGDGPCSSTPDVKFSYLSGINDQNHSQAVDFSTAYPDWVNTIKSEAHTYYKSGFDHLPAIIAAKEKASPLYGGSQKPKSFQHTIYISGYWMPKNQYPRNGESYPPNGYTPFGSGFPDWSWVYFLPIMGNAQIALGTTPLIGNFEPLSPPYPPPNQAAKSQFATLWAGVGQAIGNCSVHETGWQVSISTMECDIPSGIGGECESDYVYERYVSGSLEWWYENIPGERLHWSQSATCELEHYLIGRSYASLDKSCGPVK